MSLLETECKSRVIIKVEPTCTRPAVRYFVMESCLRMSSMGHCCTAIMLCFELSGLYLTVCVCTYCH